MSAKTIVTGNLGGDPQLRFTGSGDAVLGLSVAATHSQKDKKTDRWGDVGEPLWIKATFWGAEAEHLAQILHKGSRVTVEGTLTLKKWNASNGQGGESLELHYPRFLGVIPRKGAPGASHAPQAAHGANTDRYDTALAGGTDEDPWAQPGEAPF